MTQTPSNHMRVDEETPPLYLSISLPLYLSLYLSLSLSLSLSPTRSCEQSSGM
jgi:hypothetical protein